MFLSFFMQFVEFRLESDSTPEKKPIKPKDLMFKDSTLLPTDVKEK